jgi:hypothetical protein
MIFCRAEKIGLKIGLKVGLHLAQGFWYVGDVLGVSAG